MVTGNENKFREFKEVMKALFETKGIEFEQYDIDIDEYQGSPNFIATRKIKDA